MINELHGLSGTLKDSGISVYEWHKQYKPVPKATTSSPCIRIWLSEDGSVCGLESLNAEQANTLRKYGNNQQTFPAFNIAALYRITDVDRIKKLEKMETGQAKIEIAEVKSWCEHDNWIKKEKQILRCLDDCPKELAEMLSSQPSFCGSIINNLIGLCEKLISQNEGFRLSLETLIFEKLQKGENLRLMLLLLFHRGDSRRDHKADTGSNISVVLDVHNWQKYAYPVANEHTTSSLNDMLQAASLQNLNQHKKNSSSDAFGLPFSHLGATMPSVKLGGFDVTLRSMYNGQPCQYRYNKIGDESYPITHENRAKIKAALEWISNPEQKGITWEHVDRNEIVFVYPSSLPEVPLKMVSFFSNGLSKPSAKQEARFENITREFMQTLNGIPTHHKPKFFQVFTIRKMDNARSKIIFAQNTTPEALAQAAQQWTAGCRNIPKQDIGELITPFPLSVSVIANNVWKYNGDLAQGKTAVIRMKPYQGIELLLGLLSKDIRCSILHFTLSNSLGLIAYLGNFLHGGSRATDNSEVKKAKLRMNDAMLVLSFLGLLLYQSKIEKENYMEELAFLIGQFLHISDELHALYCQNKRDGQIPPQLAGNALFVAAGTTPIQALAQLSTRMNPYVAWAKQYRFENVEEKGKESWRARWLLNLFEQLSDKIASKINNDIRFGDYDRAQLFIGYMASLPITKKDGSTEILKEENSIGGENE